MDEKLRVVMAETLGVEAASIGDSTEMGTFAGWDSVRHVELIVAIEKAFAISLGPDEIMEMVSFAKIRELLAGRV